jgi:hypothetical protein
LKLRTRTALGLQSPFSRVICFDPVITKKRPSEKWCRAIVSDKLHKEPRNFALSGSRVHDPLAGLLRHCLRGGVHTRWQCWYCSMSLVSLCLVHVPACPSMSPRASANELAHLASARLERSLLYVESMMIHLDSTSHPFAKTKASTCLRSSPKSGDIHGTL